MRLLIMIAIYAAVAVFGLAVLGLILHRLPLKKTVRDMIIFISLFAVAVMMACPLIGALLPDGPVCWFFQKWGNVFSGYIMYFYGGILIIAIILVVLVGGGLVFYFIYMKKS